MGPQARLVWERLECRTPIMLRIVEPLTEAQMRWLPPNNSNSIAWLVWHLAEVENNWVRDKLHGLPKRYPLGASVRATSIEQYPSKAELLAYFHEVRGLTEQRLEQTAEEEFNRVVQDEYFGVITVRQVWSGVVTSCAWHSGQIALTNRLIPRDLSRV
ncbi:MAG: DinB family protein [Planctomycetes bacterium]|nr:DinB family protein [Planctomycetota bacterium]